MSLVGPRAGGKTTTGRRHTRTVVHLDDEEEAVAFRASPDAALAATPKPVLLDEWQATPSILGAVKRSVDEDSSPGRLSPHRERPRRADRDEMARHWPGCSAEDVRPHGA